jgi:hypothetical protein
MKKVILMALALAAVIVPAALATTPTQASSTYCKANAAGLIGVGKTYKTLGGCVAKQTAQAGTNAANAAKECKAEMAESNAAAFAADHGGKTFAQFYTVNGKGNALGKCVSMKAKAKTAAQHTAQLTAVKTCRTDTMKAVTGAGKQYRNFGACVSAQTKLT